ncbi:glycosyltransferase family 2 protein [Sorangium sp. So ce124]|uniref:glycosyltransferase family 2 protein n=1 Tax=Sorangium sp. So ce124 TaxID=3133280 RepID=UPI003F6391B0
MSVDISVVIPVYNEEPAIEHSLEVVRAHLDKIGRSYELVCVDDGSRDRTLERLLAAAAADPRVRPVPLARNFGKEAAMAAGLSEARGRALIFMDADLQHPPSLIARMVELWAEGYDVVSAVKETRARESLVYRMMTWVFNALMAGAARGDFRGASDFKLIDRQVVDALMQCAERNRFFRGLVTWVGFRTTEIPFTVAERLHGTTKWSVVGLIRYSIRNLIAFSALPLKMVTAMGFGTLVFAAGLGAQTLWRYLDGEALSGFTTVILLQLILGGLLLTSVGVIALYVAVIYDEVKHRPMFLVRRPRPGEDGGAREDRGAPARADADRAGSGADG